MAQTVILQEYVASPRRKLRVDREAGVVYGCKILGWESDNGRSYLAGGVAERLYEGRKINTDHPKRSSDPRSVYDRFGKFRNVQKQADGLYGDAHVLKSHPMAERFFEAAERADEMDDVFGFSHNARGTESRKSGRAVIESVDEVYSVDFVADPATTRGLREGREVTTKRFTCRQVLEAVARKKGRKLLEQMPGEDAPFPDELPADDAGAPAMDEPEMDPEQKAQEGFEAMAIAVLQDDTLDKGGKLAKLRLIIDAQEKLLAPPTEMAPSEPDGEGGEDMSAEESRKLKGEVANLREQIKCRDLIDANGLRFKSEDGKAAFVKSLVPLSDRERKALVEERRGEQRGGGAPISGERRHTRVQENKAGKLPDKVESLAKLLN